MKTSLCLLVLGTVSVLFEDYIHAPIVKMHLQRYLELSQNISGLCKYCRPLNIVVVGDIAPNQRKRPTSIPEGSFILQPHIQHMNWNNLISVPYEPVEI